jgi:hypothetical protein
MSTWQSDKGWSDRFIPEIKRHCADVILNEAPLEEDQKHNTDLIVLKGGETRIACRIRRHKYISYKDDFTVRFARPNGTPTEFDKVISGWGDYFFYGFSDEEEKSLAHWWIMDLRVFRNWLVWYLLSSGGNLPGVSRDNFDGSSSFLAIPWKLIYNERQEIIASWGPRAGAQDIQRQSHG